MQTVSLEFKGTHEADGALDDVVILYRLRMLVFEPSRRDIAHFKVWLWAPTQSQNEGGAWNDHNIYAATRLKLTFSRRSPWYRCQGRRRR